MPNEPPLYRRLLDTDIRQVGVILGWMLIAWGLLLALQFIWPAVRLLIETLLPFVVALIAAYIFDPIVTFAQRRLRISRIGGVVVLYGTILVALSAFAAIALPILINQIGNAYNGIGQFVRGRLEAVPQISSMVQTVTAWLAERGYTIDALASRAASSEGVQEAAKTAASSGARAVGVVIEFVLGLISSTVAGLLFLTFAFLVNIYLLLEFSKLRHLLEITVPEKHHENTFRILGKVDVAVGGFIRGMIITACIVGVLTFAGLYALGLREYALLIGIVAGFGNLVPYLGPISGGGPALLYVIFSGHYATTREQLIYGAAVLGLTVVIQIIEGFILQPKVVGKSAQLHPIAVLFALALGANFGLLGMIVAVPAACIVRVLVKEAYWDEREANWKRRTGRQYLGELEPAPASVAKAKRKK